MTHYQAATLAEVLSAGLFAVGLVFFVGRRSPLWNATTKTLIALGAAISFTNAAYLAAIVFEPPHHDALRPYLHVSKDVAGAAGVCLLAMIAGQILVVVEHRRERGVAQLFEGAPLPFVVAGAAALVVAAGNPVPATNLDLSDAPRAELYRLVIGAPSILYANLTALFFFEAYVRRRLEPEARPRTRQEATLITRYLYVSGAAASLGAIAVVQAAWPAAHAAHPSGLVQAALLLTFVACGLGGLLLPFEPGEIDHSMASFDQYQEVFAEHLAFEVHALGLETKHLPPHLPPHVPPGPSQRELLRSANRLLRSSGQQPPLTEEELVLAQKTLTLAARISCARQSGGPDARDFLERLEVFSALPARYVPHIPDYAPHRDLAANEGVVDRAVRAARTLTQPKDPLRLRAAPAWLQLCAALLAVFGGVLTPVQERNVLDESDPHVEPHIRWAALWAAYALEKSTAFGPPSA